jgi:hypothetical protein
VSNNALRVVIERRMIDDSVDKSRGERTALLIEKKADVARRKAELLVSLLSVLRVVVRAFVG